MAGAPGSPHVIVTGGARGIGYATASRLVERWGATCSVLDLERLPSTADGRIRAYECDVTDQAAVHLAVGQACGHSGPPAGLVTAAGIVSNDATMSIEADDWRRIVGTHLDGTLYACQAAGQRMQGSGGAIVTLCSVAMDFGVPGRAAYGAAKAAIRSLTKTLACEWAEYGIRVNAVAPGDVRTDMYEQLVALKVLDEQAVRAGHALGRVAEPDEVAAAVEFLLGDESSFVTGELLRVDGGFSVCKM